MGKWGKIVNITDNVGEIWYYSKSDLCSKCYKIKNIPSHLKERDKVKFYIDKHNNIKLL